MSASGMGHGHDHDDRYLPAVDAVLAQPIALTPGAAYLAQVELWAVSADATVHAWFRSRLVVLVATAADDAVLVDTPVLEASATDDVTEDALAWAPTITAVAGGIQIDTTAPSDAVASARLTLRVLGAA